MTQISLIQIDNYGPWTVEPEPRRETDIQALQSNLYADLCSMFGSRGGLVFFSRFDNMVAVTDGISEEEHRRVQESVNNRYPVTVSIGVGRGTPREATEEATGRLQREGGAQDSSRESSLSFGETGESSTSGTVSSKGHEVQIGHCDIDGVTRKYTDELDGYESHLRIQEGYTRLARRMWEGHGSLTFFVGGDNFISVASGLDRHDFDEVIETVDAFDLKVGVGEGDVPETASRRAKMGLERCRETQERVCYGASVSSTR
ncbi:MAG: GTP cyclohydrolase IIa [Halobacteria archaeon]|nr:GTP cyclohydrolase IIa [Halobacteria archaeon]